MKARNVFFVSPSPNSTKSTANGTPILISAGLEASKPVILALTYPSATGSATGCLPGDAGACLDGRLLSQPNPDQPGIALDLAGQSTAYNAILLAVRDRPWIAGVVMPTLIIIGLMAIPYIDTNPLGAGYYTLKQRRFAIGSFAFGFIVLWVAMIIIGTFIRGPGWQWKTVINAAGALATGAGTAICSATFCGEDASSRNTAPAAGVTVPQRSTVVICIVSPLKPPVKCMYPVCPSAAG